MSSLFFKIHFIFHTIYKLIKLPVGIKKNKARKLKYLRIFFLHFNNVLKSYYALTNSVQLKIELLNINFIFA